MNIDLLKKLANKFKRMRHKQHFNMDDWIRRTECGTAACVAGWALLEAGYKATFEVLNGGCDCASCSKPELIVISPSGKRVDPEQAAQKLLRLTDNQAERLFHSSQWPSKFGDYNDPKVAAKRIELFIDTHGKE